MIKLIRNNKRTLKKNNNGALRAQVKYTIYINLDSSSIVRNNSNKNLQWDLWWVMVLIFPIPRRSVQSIKEKENQKTTEWLTTKCVAYVK